MGQESWLERVLLFWWRDPEIRTESHWYIRSTQILSCQSSGYGSCVGRHRWCLESEDQEFTRRQRVLRYGRSSNQQWRSPQVSFHTFPVLLIPLTPASNWRWPQIEGLHTFKGVLAHTAVYDRSIDLDGKRVAVIGMGSTGLQLVPTIAPKVAHLYTFVRSPTWVTPGFAQKYAGPGGTNFECIESDPLNHLLDWHITSTDSEEQKEHFRNNHTEYQRYNKGIENELNVRFRYILQGTPEALEAKKVRCHNFDFEGTWALTCVQFSIDNMKSRLGGREDLEDAIIPKNFGLGCRRPTVSDWTSRNRKTIRWRTCLISLVLDF